MIFDKIPEKRDAEINVNDWQDVYSTEAGYEGAFSSALHESDYFKSIKIISSSIAKVPLIVRQSTDNGEVIARKHPLYDLLKNRPNPWMSSVDFFKATEATRQHNGDSAALIVRGTKNKVAALYPINIIEIVIDDAGLCKTKKVINPVMITYTTGRDGVQYYARYEDVLHFKGMTLDGMNSLSIRKKLEATIDTAISAKKYQNELFKNGLTQKAVVQLTSDIKDEKELQKMQEKFGRLYSSGKRIMTVPAGFTIQPLNLSLVDSEFSILRKMGTTDIATLFGIPLYMFGILDSYNNASMEMAQLSFLNDTLSVLFISIEQEINYKLLTEADRQAGYYVEFDTSYLYKVDAKTQTELLVSQVQNGITRINEARRKLGYEDDVNGDELLLHSGMTVLSSVLNPVKIIDTTIVQ